MAITGGVGGGATANNPSNVSTASSAAQQSALAILDQQLEAWDLSSLEPTALSLIQSGLNSDAVQFQLEQSQAFKDRFAGNIERAKNGLRVLSPGEYLATEQSYNQALRQYGIQDTFGTRDNFAKWIAGDVSSTELQTRIQEGSDQVNNSDPTSRNLLQQWYGIGHSDLLSTFLDPTQAQNGLDKKAYAANVGAAMQRYGLGASQSSAEGLYGTVTESQAVSGIQNAGQSFARTQNLAQRYGATYSAQDAINQYVLGQQAPADKQTMLSQLEEGQFSQGKGYSQGVGTAPSGF